ncbi:MAG: hypothetical protein M1339_08640 [Bacteroidetes bacterium]|nr:hypothetical protein [Bacteroidota bacterium]
MLGVPAKIGIPQTFDGGFAREVENPMYATAVGLVQYGLKRGAGKSTIEFVEPVQDKQESETKAGPKNGKDDKSSTPGKRDPFGIGKGVQFLKKFINKNIDNV